MRHLILFVLAALFAAACGSSTESAPPPSNGNSGHGDVTEPGKQITRTLAVAPDAELFSRVEGVDAKNDCASDADCKPSGCSKEVCAAEELMTACDVQAWPQGDGASCGCVDKQCVWYR